MNISKTAVQQSKLIQNSCCRHWQLKRTITKRSHTNSMSYTLKKGKLLIETDTDSIVNYMKKMYNKNQYQLDVCKSATQSVISSTSTHKNNYYDLLGVKRNASINDIKNAYYFLAKAYHPDVTEFGNPEKSTKFQQISEAYSCLIDENKRLEYDKFGNVKPKKLLPLESTLNDMETTEKFIKNDNKNEICITLSFVQAALGIKRDINISNKIECYKCKALNANNTIQTKNCTNCDGRGTIQNHHRLAITVPAGVSDGDVIKILHPIEKKYIQIRCKIEPSQIFTKMDFNVCSTIEIPFTTAILGGTIFVKTIHGDVGVKIPTGTDYNTVIRIKGSGIQKSDFGSGDHLAKIIIKMPKHLTNRQKLLLKSFNHIESKSEINQDDETNKQMDNKQDNSILKHFWKKNKNFH